MRIGLIAPPWVPVPPTGYGGTEVVIDNLARGLQALGHEVRLFTVGESDCEVPSDYFYPTAVEPIGMTVPEAAHVIAAYEELAHCDVIHDNTVLGPLLAGTAGMRRPPVVTTNHGPFTHVTSKIYTKIARYASIVCISRSQARSAGQIPVAAVIHHGVDLDAYSYGHGAGDYLMFVGRMNPVKGVHHAVRVAQKAGRRLVIASKMREPQEIEYFERAVRPLLADGDEGPREMPQAERIALLREASALVNPIRWREPFGMVMPEAMAAGTPVLAFPNGAAPEIVDPGRNGFLCRDEEEMVAAVERVPEVDRRDCRRAAERRFSHLRMARDHERLYRWLLEREVGIVGRLPAAQGRRLSA